MKIFLRLRHWQIFLLSWGPLSCVFILLYTLPLFFVNNFHLWLIVFLVALMNSFIWVFAIATELQKFTATIHSAFFKIAFWIPFIYVWASIAFALFNFFVRKVKSVNIDIEMMAFAGGGSLSVICIIYGLAFIGRLIRSIELKRRPTIKDHIIESVLMLFPPVGIWIIQPRINRIVADRGQ